ncbi:MmcQ/YjbR family DNA-binding protein [Kribbella sp. NPDC000426]|uniref:MmcQ/YjbR family DNA-binding protein n=1 Tax=Kribbella sp. NPDC000426 TaxID=3154255 RepID=UPI00333375A3
MADVHEIASGMPHVTKWERDDGTDRPVYQVGGKSFVFFRTPRPDAVDPVTGEKYDDVIMIWVESEDEKLALVADEATPFFTTPHFDGHPSVLIRGSELAEISRQELTEIIQDAWLSRASNRRATTWLKEHRLS